jgi:hypothetical protein
MSIIYKTTVIPSKLELLTGWLPAQPWYLDRGRAPELAKAGGFRLDDPDGEVGIEFMVVTDGPGNGSGDGDGGGDQVAAYLVPMTYRASALPGADGALIGTAEHGVLGRRWIYDGTRDPVFVSQLAALMHGAAEPQAQSINNTPDPTVTVVPVAGGGELIIRINRVLQPGDGALSGEAGQPCLFATWRRPDGTRVRGALASAKYAHTAAQ